MVLGYRSISKLKVIIYLVFVCIASALGYGTVEGQGQDIVIELGDLGFDMELDPARERLYVSLPARNEVVIISTQSYTIIDRVVVGTRPQGIDMSVDGSLLFGALNQASSVAYLDLDTFDVTQVVIGAELGDARTYDVIEGKPNRVFVSANPGSNGLSYIVMIKRDQGNAAVRVASNRIIRARPVFEGSPDNQSLYIGEGFSPNSLYKLDLSTDDAPIVLEDQHGSVSGTDHLEVSPDGMRIYLGSGQVLRTGSFIQIGLIGSGVPTLNQSGTLAFVAKEPNTIEVYDTATFLMVDTITIPCSFNDIKSLELLPNGTGYLVLGDDLVCGVTSQAVTSLALSPSSGRYVTTQIFDLTLIVQAPGLAVVGGSATLDGSDVTDALAVCVIPGTLLSGGQTFRCPGLTGGLFGPGPHTLGVTLDLSDGSSVSDTVIWEVLENTEP